MMRNKKVRVVEKKKASTGKKIMKAVVIMAAVNACIKVFSIYTNRKAKKTDLPDGEYSYNLMMDGKQLIFENQDVKKITLTAKMSGVDLDLSNITDINRLSIICKGLLSGICIRVPKNIAVKNSLTSKFSSIAKSVPDYLDENLPTIYISGNMYLSGVGIRLVED